MVRSLIRCGALALLVGAGACSLDVQNPNSPETERVLATPQDVEALLGTQYLRWHQGVYSGGAANSLSNIRGMAAVLSFENFSSLANNGMGAVISIPRGVLDNQVGNGFATEQRRLYYTVNESGRNVSNALARLAQPGFTLGSPARDGRARAFAEFVRGLSIGYAALIHDSTAIITPDLATDDPGELVSYQAAMTEAIAALQNAIDAATASAAGSDGFPLPSAWYPSPTAMTSAEFVRLVRSYRARLRANVARTPTERAAVDWDLVIADAQAGITADHYVTMNTTTGPNNTWVRQWMGFTTWHQMTPFVVGMADVSGSYAAWNALSLDSRGTSGAFFMVTPDLRFPQGATRAAQQADLALPCPPPPTGCGKRYFRNRPTGSDNVSGATWGWSNYDHVRFHPWHEKGDAGAGGNGNFPLFTKAELHLLEAEGHFRKQSYALAAGLINKTREANGLPAITAFDATSPVPGGANCVPKVPVGPSYSTVACGNMLEALKYEKRIETAYTHFAAWYLDGRGWGDLPEGTGVHWAVPYEDLQARGRIGDQIYSTGGGGYGSAAKGTYGW